MSYVERLVDRVSEVSLLASGPDSTRLGSASFSRVLDYVGVASAGLRAMGGVVGTDRLRGLMENVVIAFIGLLQLAVAALHLPPVAIQKFL